MNGDGHSPHIEFRSRRGTLLSKEENVQLSDTPEAVQSQIKSLVGNGKVLGVSKITEDDQVSFDVDLKNGGREKTVSLGSDGKILPADEN